ncbi:MAG: hypothetical protein JWL74_1584 [Alphaproteobacteria bacterium]|nr:hypothetical protein [Alphaproteobacteria bacterium]
MRLILKAFCAAAAFTGASAAQAQAGVSYEPPPVDFVQPGEAPVPLAAASSGTVPEAAIPVQEPVVGPGHDAPRPRLRVNVGAYVELNQGVSVELAGNGPGDDVVTYTAVAAGVEGQVRTRRVTASGAYRYERRLGWTEDLPDEDVHSGIAQAHAELVPGRVSVDAGALAARTGGTGRAVGITDREAGTEIYSAYAGPTLSTRAGPVEINAAYRLGYVHVDDDSLSGAAAPTDDFDSTVHVANVSVGVAPGGPLPIGLTASAGYVREDSGALDNRFEGRFVRADVVVPVSPTFAVTGGVGYSRTEASQQNIRRSPGGVPLRDSAGRVIPDPTASRVTTLDTDGVYWDAGILWRPTPRAEIQVRAGQDDDGDMLVMGSATVQIGRRSGISATLFDHDTSFGQGIISSLRRLPAAFNINPDPLRDRGFGDCVFGEEPGQGSCLASSLQSISSIAFRARGGSLVFTSTGRLWNIGAGLAYTHRSFYLPDDPLFASVFAREDQDLNGFVYVSRRLTRDVTLTLNPYFSFYDNDLDVGLGLGGLGGIGDGFSTGTSFGLSRSFLSNRLQLLLTLGLNYSTLRGDDSLVADGLIGVRYVF